MNKIHCDWCDSALADKMYISLNVVQFNRPVGGPIPIVIGREPMAFCDRSCLIGFVQGSTRFDLPVDETPEVESGEEVADVDAGGSDPALEATPA